MYSDLLRLFVKISPQLDEIAGLAILIGMPELGGIENKAAASLAGLAPIARESGGE
jgi:transposase